LIARSIPRSLTTTSRGLNVLHAVPSVSVPSGDSFDAE